MSSHAQDHNSGEMLEERAGLTGWLARNRIVVNAVMALVVLGFVAFAINRLTQEVRYDDIINTWAETSWQSVARAGLFTVISFVALTFYDFGAFAYVGRKVPYPAVAATAFAAYAVGNTAGFGPLSGGAIRYRAYSRLGVPPEDIGAIIAFVTVAFGLGLATVAAVSVLFIAGEIGPLIQTSPTVLRLIAVAILVPVVLLPFASRLTFLPVVSRLAVKIPGPAVVARQILVTAVDVAASAAVLFVLLPQGDVGFPAFLAIYAVAVGLGVLSHVPAGLGVFETVIVAALGSSVDVDDVLGGLILYRIVYHLLPLILAAIFVSVTELRQAAGSPLAKGLRRAGTRLSPPILSTLALLIGAMLIFSSVTPTPDDNLAYLAQFVPLPVVEGAHFIASLLGLALIVISRGLSQRLDGAWWAALVSTILAFVLSLLKAVAVFEASVLCFLAFALLATRRRFDRPASLLTQALTLPWLVAMATVVFGAMATLFFVFRDVDYSHTLWWQFEFTSEAPRGLRALLGLAIIASMLAIWSLLRPAVGGVANLDPDTLEKAIAIAQNQAMADSNMVRMGDKSVLLSDDGRAFIMYARQNRSWVALFDPIGARDCWSELIWRFIEAARANGCRAVFYQVSPEALSLYADAGLQAFKLGELATIDLKKFDIKGGKRAGLRQSVSRGERDGLIFSMVAPADVPAIMTELKAVSDAWLSHHDAREKGFSLGAFDPDYIASQPVAVMRVAGRIVAFANVLVTATKDEASVDLMRFAPNAPKGAMDFLFMKLILQMKDEGYRHFNLGMAPLSGMSERQIAPVWNRVGRTVFEHGERYYNFQGLRAFKSKFHPEWQPRYLAVSGGINPVLALMDATFLIGGGLKGF